MEIKQLIRETKQLEKEIVAQKAKYDENRRKIQTYFDKHDIKDLEVEKTENTNQMVASKIERAYIDYDVEKLKETFDKEILNEIILKSYSIIDIEALKSMVSRCRRKAGLFRDAWSLPLFGWSLLSR
jgi:hypothetical protein